MTTPDGGQSTADAGQSAASGTNNQPDGTTPGSEPTGQSAGATSTGSTTPPEDNVSRKDFDAIRNQLSAADKARQEAQAALQAIRDKDLPELDKLKRDFSEAAKARDEAIAQLGQVRMENAFLKDNTKAWKNSGSALKLLDLSKVTIDSEGNVIGMKDAIEALAKSDPYLLEDKKPEPETPPVGGTVPGNNGKGGATPNTKQMATRFSALGTRRIGS